MKAQSLSAFLVLAASVQQVAGWGDAPAYKCPKNSCDKCTTQQSSGFDWTDLATGDFSFYGGFDFEGFTCSNSFGKRDLLTGRTFGSKCISGSASSEPEKCPKASCHDTPSFSIDTLEISVEFDVDLEFHYGMEDGSTCKHKSSCSKEGSSIKNTQCGGAKNVTVVLPTPPPSKPTCSVGIHSIGFNCPSSCTSTPTTTPTPMSYTLPTVVSTTTTAPVETTPSSTPASTILTTTRSSSAASSAGTSSSPVSTAPSSSVGSSTATSSAPVSTVPSSSAGSSAGTSSAPVYTVPSSSVGSSTATSSAPVSTVSSSSAESSGATGSATVSTVPPSSVTSPVTTSAPAQSITTVIVDTTVTTCPVTNIHTTGGTTSTEITQTVSTITTTRTSTVCTKCSAAAATSGVTSASPAQETVACPSVLPSCLNTWMTLVTDCTSIDDYNCFCPSSNLTSLVFGCLSAHGASDTEVSAAQVYFQGICAQYVPQNPAIITAASALAATATIAGPVITIDIYTTVVVPCTQSNGPASTISTISSAVTVPQVVLTTVTGSSVGLVQGTPTPLTTTAAAAAAGVAPTTMATVTPTKGVAGATGTVSANPSKFTGAASRSNVAYGVIGAAFAFSFFAM